MLGLVSCGVSGVKPTLLIKFDGRSRFWSMEELKWELEKKQVRLRKLLDARSDANCTDGKRTEGDIKREEEIEDLGREIEELEAKLRAQA